MNHFARYTAPIVFFVNLTCYKASFEKDCTLTIKSVIWNFFVHGLFTILVFFHFIKYFLVFRERSLVTLKSIIKLVEEYMNLFKVFVGELDCCIICAEIYG